MGQLVPVSISKRKQICSQSTDKSDLLRSLACYHLPWKTENTLTCLNLHDGCTYLWDPRGDLRDGESECLKVFLWMPTTVAQWCVGIVATRVLGTNCDSAHDWTGVSALTGQVGSQGWKELLCCTFQVCRDAWDISLKINTLNLTGLWSTLTKLLYYLASHNHSSKKPMVQVYQQ